MPLTWYFIDTADRLPSVEWLSVWLSGLSWYQQFSSQAGQRLTGCAGGQVRIEGRPITRVLGAKSRFWAADGSAVGVEELALQYYATPEAGGWKGERCSCLHFIMQHCGQ